MSIPADHIPDLISVEDFMEDFFDSKVIYFHWLLAGYANYNSYTTGSGSVGVSHRGYALHTGTTSDSIAQWSLYRYYGSATNTNKEPKVTWDRRRMFKIIVTLTENTNQTGYIVSGRSGTDKHVGFYFENDTLYMSVADGTTENTSLIQTFSAGDYFALKAKHFPGDRAEFYVDGDFVGELTSNLPSGVQDYDNYVFARIYNTAAEAKDLSSSEAWFLQLED